MYQEKEAIVEMFDTQWDVSGEFTMGFKGGKYEPPENAGFIDYRILHHGADITDLLQERIAERIADRAAEQILKEGE